MKSRHGSRGVIGVVASLAIAACTSGGDSPAGVDAAAAPFVDPTPPAAVAPLAQVARDHAVVAMSLDDAGRPRFLRAVQPLAAPAGATPELAARAFVDQLAPVWGTRTPADLGLDAVHPLRGGATIVSLRQQIGGVAIWGGRLGVLLGPDGSLRAIGGTRVERADGAREAFMLDGDAATAIAVADRFGAGATLGPSQHQRALLPIGDRLVATWVVEAYGGPAGGTDTHLWRVFVDAATGDVLRRDDLTVDVAFTYRVFADADAAGRPFDGPQQSFAPHPTGVPDGSQPAFVAPNLVSMDGFNSSADPWLAATATTSNGNNVDAYADRSAPDGLSGTDFRASTTGTRAFDRVYDVAQGPLVSQAQGMAAVTHLFYLNNWLHDWWYDSGFDEAAGNAQVNNFGRGGNGGDPIHAEAQDDAIGGSRNNANMATPSDGMSPTMQMYLWSGASPHSLTVNPGSQTFGTAVGDFGPQVFDVTNTVVQASDATHEACGAITGAAGRIVLVNRGTCTFTQKAQNIANANGIGMILANTGPGTENMAGTGATLPPSLMVSQADGAAIRALVVAGATTAHMVRGAAGVERDGDIDTAIVAHEWGHYLHHRLAGCGAAQCSAMSEGWGDFNAMMTILRATDDPHGTYPMGVYGGVSFADAYYGIRRAPYSTNFAKNGFTFRHIQQSAVLPTTFPIAFSGNNEEAHNAGEVWTAMMWQAYVALVDKDGYTAAHREMSDYVVAGLQLTPGDATFTEARDALLAATNAIDPTDTIALAQAFALRGAGSCAVSPAGNSTTLNGVVEDFSLRGKLGVGAVTIADDRVTCDTDGILDGGETGTLRVAIVNGGMAALTGTTITVSTTTPGVTILAPSHAAAPIAALSSSIETFAIRMSPTVTAQTAIAIAVQLSDAGACTTTASATASVRGEYDVMANASANDNVEADATVWTRAGSVGVWNRELLGTSMGWHGLDLGSATDAQLVSPPLVVGAGNFTVGFSHRFDFEFSANTYFDGGLIEISTNGGGTWADAQTFGPNPGYTGTLTTTSGNPLGGRRAYGRRNAAYPNRNTVSLAFGTQFAGQTILLRFRVGTDAGAGAGGWELDDLTFAGLTNTPFPVILAEGATCQAAPLANAGADLIVGTGAAVALAGTASDPNGDPITFAWTQTAGPAVTLSGATTLAPAFTAPAAPTTLTFQLAVSDPFATTTDSVNVTVTMAPPPIDAGVDAAIDAPADAAIDAPADAPADAPDDAAIDAPDDAAPPVDDAAPPDDDATPPELDAAPPVIDATPPTIDAATSGGDPSGGCCSTGGGGAQSSSLLALGALGFVLRRRRR